MMDGKNLDPWFEKNLVCPRNRQPLQLKEDRLVSSEGFEYPIVDGVPVMLLEDVEQTLWVANASLARAKGVLVDRRAPQLYLESLGISEMEREGVVELAKSPRNPVDPVISFLIGATNGIMYNDLKSKLNDYPIPNSPLPQVQGKWLLDLGCGWGRWTVAVQRKGYTCVGVDPSLGAIMAARRLASRMGIPVRFLVADARFLPFREKTFDVVFSYSVVQHFSYQDAMRCFEEIGRVLEVGGRCLVQMPNKLGIRCLYHQAKRGFREPKDFEVRYWSIRRLRKAFASSVGKVSFSVDCFFGLGLQRSDIPLLSLAPRLLIYLSEWLKKWSRYVQVLVYLADSVYVHACKVCPDDVQSPGHRSTIP